MPISDEMRDVNMKFECPYCSLPVVHRGTWFKVMASFKCAGCGAKVRIGYQDKLALFERNRQGQNGTLVRHNV